jgi:hypothetical protein
MPEISNRASKAGIIELLTAPHMDSRLNIAGKTSNFSFHFIMRRLREEGFFSHHGFDDG